MGPVTPAPSVRRPQLGFSAKTASFPVQKPTRGRRAEGASMDPIHWLEENLDKQKNKKTTKQP